MLDGLCRQEFAYVPAPTLCQFPAKRSGARPDSLRSVFISAVEQNINASTRAGEVLKKKTKQNIWNSILRCLLGVFQVNRINVVMSFKV